MRSTTKPNYPQLRLRGHRAQAFLLGALALAPMLAFGQGAAGWRESKVVLTPKGEWTGERLLDGQPDVQGHWSNTIANHNSLENPQGGGNAEAAPGRGGRGGGQRQQQQAQTERAPSRVTDPPDGKVPLQPWARAKAEEFAKYLNNPIKPEYVEPSAHCAPAGPTKSFYWHGYEIRQYPGYVLFMFNSGNRVIHLNAKPHLPENLKLWNGDSRGHWEGNTLVVDTTNNNSKWRFARSSEFVSENATVVERFIFDPKGDRFTYEATWTDPTVLTRPFTITVPAKRVTDKTPPDDWNNETFLAKHEGSDPIIEDYERVCVEGNGTHGLVVADSK
jgi:hypothetical protein